MIDNYDSFTYNLVQYLQALNAEVVVHRNDQISLSEIEKLKPEKMVISPGPGRPEAAGITLPLIKQFAGKIPILGVCLGHQAIAQAFGANIIRAKAVMHGKTSLIDHEGRGVFKGLSSPFTATRYHSLVIDPKSLPDEFEITARVKHEDSGHDEIMGIRHRAWRLEGVQFHPESVLTEAGYSLLENFLKL